MKAARYDWPAGSGRLAHEHADALRALGLLRARRERPSCRATECGEKFAPRNHSITSSAKM
jgi:hypothetical protein